jgi:L-alanine-DL-glutamate epimerase-like enolase superfamily enzyme
LRLWDDAGRLGQGEASPLPGHSPDTLADCRAVLERVPWGALPDLDPIRPLAPQIAAADLVPTSCPAARFAVETALLDLVAQRAGRPAWSLLGARTGAQPIALAALIDASDARTALRDAERALERGVGTLKAKIGRPGAFQAELASLRALRRTLGGGTRLRADANGAFAAAEAGERLAALADLGLEFVEEPVPAADLARLTAPPVPLALDESLAPPGSWERLSGRLAELHCTTVVLKPMLLGGLFRTANLAARARERGLAVVVSHLFDGPVALAAAAALALAVASPGCASGLDRHVGLSSWPALDVPLVGPAALIPDGRPGLGIEPLGSA